MTPEGGPGHEVSLEAWQLERMVEEGEVATPVLRRAAVNLFVATTVKSMVEGDASPLEARRLLDTAVSESRAVTSLDRQSMIHAMHARFGMEALVRQLNYLGQRMQGVEVPEVVAMLGERPVIRLDGEPVFTGRPALVRDVFDTLAGRKPVGMAIRRQVADWCGIDVNDGTLSLHRQDGEKIDEADLALATNTDVHRAGV